MKIMLDTKFSASTKKSVDVPPQALETACRVVGLFGENAQLARDVRSIEFTWEGGSFNADLHIVVTVMDKRRVRKSRYCFNFRLGQDCPSAEAVAKVIIDSSFNV